MDVHVVSGMNVDVGVDVDVDVDVDVGVRVDVDVDVVRVGVLEGVFLGGIGCGRSGGARLSHAVRKWACMYTQPSWSNMHAQELSESYTIQSIPIDTHRFCATAAGCIPCVCMDACDRCAFTHSGDAMMHKHCMRLSACMHGVVVLQTNLACRIPLYVCMDAHVALGCCMYCQALDQHHVCTDLDLNMYCHS